MVGLLDSVPRISDETKNRDSLCYRRVHVKDSTAADERCLGKLP